jgi:hypothetical protein
VGPQGGRRGRRERPLQFEVAKADAYPGDGYDLVAIFDALHDMGDLLAEAGFTRVRRATGTPFNRVFEARP